jgi:hypothetical protein
VILSSQEEDVFWYVFTAAGRALPLPRYRAFHDSTPRSHNPSRAENAIADTLTIMMIDGFPSSSGKHPYISYTYLNQNSRTESRTCGGITRVAMYQNQTRQDQSHLSL